MYTETKKLSSALDEKTLIPASATQRDEMLRWLPWPQLPGHVTRYAWDDKLDRVRVWQEPVAGQGKPAETAQEKAAQSLPADQQPGTHVPELSKLPMPELETRAVELGVENVAKLKRQPAQLVAAVAKRMAERAGEKK